MTCVQDIRIQNLKGMLAYIKRADFCEKVGIEYNLLNQYLGKNSKKKLGTILASRISVALGFEPGWMDHLHSRYELSSAVGVVFDQQKSMMRADRIYTVGQRFSTLFCDLDESEGINAFMMRQKTFAKHLSLVSNYHLFRTKLPLSFGYFSSAVLCCSGNLVPGDQSLLLFGDGAVALTEYLYKDTHYIYVQDWNGERKAYALDELIYESGINMVLQCTKGI